MRMRAGVPPARIFLARMPLLQLRPASLAVAELTTRGARTVGSALLSLKGFSFAGILSTDCESNIQLRRNELKVP